MIEWRTNEGKAETNMGLDKVQKAIDLVNDNSIKPKIASCKNALLTKGKRLLPKEKFETKMNVLVIKLILPSYRKTE